MNHIKSNPVGIDAQIQKMQSNLYDKLGFANIDGYGRVYPIDKDGKVIPAYFINGNDYKSVLMDDRLNAIFFFLESEESTPGTKMQTEVSIIFQLNLKKLYPDVIQRMDEEVRVHILERISRIKYFKTTLVTKGIEALEGFDTDLRDMQPYHYLKVTGNLRYSLNC